MMPTTTPSAQHAKSLQDIKLWLLLHYAEVIDQRIDCSAIPNGKKIKFNGKGIANEIFHWK